MARVLVDKLLEQKGSMLSKDLYNILPNKFKLYLKTAKGLKGFVQFYPALFQTEEETTDDKIELMAVPIFKSEKDLKLPHGFDPKKGLKILRYSSEIIVEIGSVETLPLKMGSSAGS